MGAKPGKGQKEGAQASSKGQKPPAKEAPPPSPTVATPQPPPPFTSPTNATTQGTLFLVGNWHPCGPTKFEQIIKQTWKHTPPEYVQVPTKPDKVQFHARTVPFEPNHADLRIISWNFKEVCPPIFIVAP